MVYWYAHLLLIVGLSHPLHPHICFQPSRQDASLKRSSTAYCLRTVLVARTYRKNHVILVDHIIHICARHSSVRITSHHAFLNVWKIVHEVARQVLDIRSPFRMFSHSERLRLWLVQSRRIPHSFIVYFQERYFGSVRCSALFTSCHTAKQRLTNPWYQSLSFRCAHHGKGPCRLCLAVGKGAGIVAFEGIFYYVRTKIIKNLLLGCIVVIVCVAGPIRVIKRKVFIFLSVDFSATSRCLSVENPCFFSIHLYNHFCIHRQLPLVKGTNSHRYLHLSRGYKDRIDFAKRYWYSAVYFVTFTFS